MYPSVHLVTGPQDLLTTIFRYKQRQTTQTEFLNLTMKLSILQYNYISYNRITYLTIELHILQ